MKPSEIMWRKSSYSADNNGNCIELADLATAVGVRDSKDPHGPQLTVTRENLGVITGIIKDF
ncbi:DUF397 domain-containing protein [Actinomadura rupiterrae]|uniref:DUF397 domain-containing protein n=1 Tax=Actinomadura rupiterrae TaxID=559627 RepID=UPI0020A45CDC|nr:DUF397 domain-containing protein [Actinomadura rupiterrae]MCP2342546.1 hypothetical protein [Actinomadura rupiterrae]